jgi:hypothetical protein
MKTVRGGGKKRGEVAFFITTTMQTNARASLLASPSLSLLFLLFPRGEAPREEEEGREGLLPLGSSHLLLLLLLLRHSGNGARGTQWKRKLRRRPHCGRRTRGKRRRRRPSSIDSRERSNKQNQFTKVRSERGRSEREVRGNPLSPTIPVALTDAA